MSKVPRLRPELADEINRLISIGEKIYADIDEDTGRITKIYGEKLDRKEFKKEKLKKKDKWQ